MTYWMHTYWQVCRLSVTLSLIEAEGVRGVMHLRQGRELIPGACTPLGLRTGSTLLDSTDLFRSCGDYQQRVIDNAWRFVDSDTHFTQVNGNMALRSIHSNIPAEYQVL